MINDLVKYIPARLMRESGKAFHAGRLAFSGQRNLYVLGLNPGGAPELHDEETLSDNLDLVLRRACERWSSFLDERWRRDRKDYPPGMAPLQLKMQELLGCLGLDPREVPASDLVFVRSRQAKDLDKRRELMEECWPFHRAVIEQLRVRVVLCLYKEVGEFVRPKVSAFSNPVDEVVQQSRSGNMTYRWQSFRAPNGLRIVQVTRPTNVPWTGHACTLTKRALESLASGRAIGRDDEIGKAKPVKLERIEYHRLNSKQKEIYNFQKSAALLADFGFNCIKLADDWLGADFLAYHKDGRETLGVQLKARLTIDRKYLGRGLWLVFPANGSWYLIEHDELVRAVGEATPWLTSSSWTEQGSYSSARPSRALLARLAENRIGPTSG